MELTDDNLSKLFQGQLVDLAAFERLLIYQILALGFKNMTCNAR